jgi:aerobic-type carbon monoxide dehydrogenase small subunit (CoxS/CutS family)
MTMEKATFIINGKLHAAEYEARTTLWEVIAMQFGLVGTNRSCNRASCGACSVLVDGMPLYSCRTLATEAVGKKILTIEGVGDEKNLHPLQSVGFTRVAADCGFCTAGILTTAHMLLTEEPEADADRIREVLSGNICRCTGYEYCAVPSWIRRQFARSRKVVPERFDLHIKCQWCGTIRQQVDTCGPDVVEASRPSRRNGRDTPA